MSLYSEDHYRVHLTEEALTQKRDAIADIQAKIEAGPAYIQRLRQELADAEERLRGLPATKETMEASLMDLDAQKQAAIARRDTESVVPSPEDLENDESRRLPTEMMDPVSLTIPWRGLADDEDVLDRDEELYEYAQLVYRIRALLNEGNIEEARKLERQATEILRGREGGEQLPVTALLNDPDGDSNGEIVASAQLVKPFSIPTDDELDETFRYASEKPNVADVRQIPVLFDFAAHWSGTSSQSRSAFSYPEEISVGLLNEIRAEVQRLAKEYARFKNERRQAREDESGDDDDEGEEEEFVIDETVLESIKATIVNRIGKRKLLYQEQLKRPSDKSAPIARYNHNPHFAFESEHARADLDPTHEGMVRCQLRMRPPNYDEGKEPVRLPFRHLESWHMDDFDVEGDLLVACGDHYANEMRISRPYLGWCKTPCPSNQELETAKQSWELKDSDGKELARFKELYKGPSGGRRSPEYFVSCVADENDRLVWAGSTVSNKVYAFPCARVRPHAPTAILRFEKPEIKSMKKYVNAGYRLIKNGDCLVGAADTPRLSVWNMRNAVAEFREQAGDDIEQQDADVDDEGSSSSESDEGDKQAKRRKVSFRTDYNPTPPRIVQFENAKSEFQTGNIQSVGQGKVLVGSLGGSGWEDESLACAMRIVDLERESVVGLLCARNSCQDIEKQYCVEEHCIFTSDCHQALVWDVRTNRPSQTLASRGRKVLGVTTASAMVAFMFSSDAESIQCWDLRKPSSHAYTMATGNATVSKLLWHAQSWSLLASVASRHAVQNGNYGAYRYGEPVEDSFESEDWPSRAAHEPGYFGTELPNPYGSEARYGWKVDDHALIQYAFENGRAMGE